MVWVYDFRARMLERQHIDSLFAIEGLNPEPVEAALGRLIETPFTGFRKKDGDRRASQLAGVMNGKAEHLLNNKAERRAPRLGVHGAGDPNPEREDR